MQPADRNQRWRADARNERSVCLDPANVHNNTAGERETYWNKSMLSTINADLMGIQVYLSSKNRPVSSPKTSYNPQQDS